MGKLTEREKKISDLILKFAIYELDVALYDKHQIKFLTELFNEKVYEKVNKFIDDLDYTIPS